MNYVKKIINIKAGEIFPNPEHQSKKQTKKRKKTKYNKLK